MNDLNDIELDKFIVEDTVGNFELEDFSKRILPYGENSLKKPPRDLSAKEQDAMIDMFEGFEE